LAVLKKGLAAGLKGYLHNRRVVRIRYAPLAGKKIVLGKSKLPIRRPLKGKKNRSELHLATSFTHGALSYVSGSYPIEGYSFSVLILDRGKAGLDVLNVEGVER